MGIRTKPLRVILGTIAFAALTAQAVAYWNPGDTATPGHASGSRASASAGTGAAGESSGSWAGPDRMQREHRESSMMCGSSSRKRPQPGIEGGAPALRSTSTRSLRRPTESSNQPQFQHNVAREDARFAMPVPHSGSPRPRRSDGR